MKVAILAFMMLLASVAFAADGTGRPAAASDSVRITQIVPTIIKVQVVTNTTSANSGAQSHKTAGTIGGSMAGWYLLGPVGAIAGGIAGHRAGDAAAAPTTTQTTTEQLVQGFTVYLKDGSSFRTTVPTFQVGQKISRADVRKFSI